MFAHVQIFKQDLLLSLETEEDQQTFLVESSDFMRAFIEDCRRLIKLANTASNLDFRWLGYYRPQRQLESMCQLGASDGLCVLNESNSSIALPSTGPPSLTETGT